MAVANSAGNFKRNVHKLTEARVRLVMSYVVHCYLEMLKQKKEYDFSKRGSVQQEDFLRNGLVDDYLSKKQYKDYYKEHISDNPLVEITFQKEENQVYRNATGPADDYIDISIKETKLSNFLSGETDDEIKFAIECKRINDSSDYSQYIGDIQKMADRDFTTFRLPYEGQIAFIENNKLSHNLVSGGVNKKLKNATTITTIQELNNTLIHSDFDGAYSSQHKRNYNSNEFSIFHLLFDYSNIVLD